MKRLFVNADDFGLSPGVCRGVAETMRSGIVTGATVMVCAPGVEDLLEQYAPELSGRLGLHLQLSAGAPCLPPERVPSLVTRNGSFPRNDEAVNSPSTDEVLDEFRAQVLKLRQFGVEPSHIDSHHHVHRLPQVFPAYCRLALELGVPARGLGVALSMALDQQGIPTAKTFIREWFKHDLTAERLLRIVERAFSPLESDGDGAVVELMTHPGYNDAVLDRRSSYTVHRERELEVLCSDELRQGLADMGVELVPPSALAEVNRGGGDA